jgi:hypothetical protein
LTSSRTACDRRDSTRHVAHEVSPAPKRRSPLAAAQPGKRTSPNRGAGSVSAPPQARRGEINERLALRVALAGFPRPRDRAHAHRKRAHSRR